jgi:hypothetical protein
MLSDKPRDAAGARRSMAFSGQEMPPSLRFWRAILFVFIPVLKCDTEKNFVFWISSRVDYMVEVWSRK